MSVSSSVGDFDLNLIKLRKPLEFADGTIQDTAYTGDGSETLAEVLAVGNNASGQDILGVGDLTAETGSFISASLAPNATMRVIDNTTGNQLLVIPASAASNLGPITQAGDQLVVASGVKNAETLTLSTWSDTNNGLRIQANSATMGAGGALATPDFYFQSVGGDKNYIKGNCAMEGTLDLATNDIANVSQIEFDDGSIQTTASQGIQVVSANFTGSSVNPTPGVFNQNLATYNSLPIGMYQYSIMYDITNTTPNPVVWNYFQITTQGSEGSPKLYTSDFTLASGDTLSSQLNLLVPMSSVGNLVIGLGSAITSGAFGTPGAVTYSFDNAILLKLTNTITP